MSLLNTRLQDLRVNSPNLSQWTLRPSRYGAQDAFMMGNNDPNTIISPELMERARSAVGRQVQVPVFDSETVTIGSTRTVTIADSENTSQLYTVSFTTYAWGFTIVPSLYMNNEIGMQADFARKFNKYLLQFAADLDSAGIAALSAGKTQVFADALGYDTTGNTLTAPLAAEQEVLGDLTAIMNANDFYGAFKVVGNTGLQAIIAKMQERGQFNEVDKTIQWLDKTMHYTNRLPNEVGSKATGYIINPGSLGQIYRHEREALLGTLLPDGTEWGIDILPMLNLPIDTYFYYGVGDYSGIAGAATADATRVAKEHYGFAIEVANVVAYNDDLAANASPILKFDIANA